VSHQRVDFPCSATSSVSERAKVLSRSRHLFLNDWNVSERLERLNRPDSFKPHSMRALHKFGLPAHILRFP